MILLWAGLAAKVDWQPIPVHTVPVKDNYVCSLLLKITFHLTALLYDQTTLLSAQCLITLITHMSNVFSKHTQPSLADDFPIYRTWDQAQGLVCHRGWSQAIFATAFWLAGWSKSLFSLISVWVWVSISNLTCLSKRLPPASTSTRLRLPSLWRLGTPVIQRSTFTKKVEAENEVQFTLVVTEGKAFHLSALKLSHVTIRCTHHPTPPHPRPNPPHPRSYQTPHYPSPPLLIPAPRAAHNTPHPTHSTLPKPLSTVRPCIIHGSYSHKTKITQ